MKIRKHKHTLPKREPCLTTQMLAARGWILRLKYGSNQWKQNIWNEAHGIKHRTLSYWWSLERIPF